MQLDTVLIIPFVDNKSQVDKTAANVHILSI